MTPLGKKNLYKIVTLTRYHICISMWKESTEISVEFPLYLYRTKLSTNS
jgi:hypothetical protein